MMCFLNETTPPELYTYCTPLSLLDSLPIDRCLGASPVHSVAPRRSRADSVRNSMWPPASQAGSRRRRLPRPPQRRLYPLLHRWVEAGPRRSIRVSCPARWGIASGVAFRTRPNARMGSGLVRPALLSRARLYEVPVELAPNRQSIRTGI